jgi:hypothetical protein
LIVGWIQRHHTLEHPVRAVKITGPPEADIEIILQAAKEKYPEARHRIISDIPTIGARKVLQLQDNLASLDLELSPEQLKVLDEASRIELGFPYDLYNAEMVRGFAYGGMRDRLVV